VPDFNCAATLIGSLPHTDAAAACAGISKYLVDLPAWPQLPMRSNLENMYIQYSQGFPGIAVDGQKIHVERGPGFDRALEQLYYDWADGVTGGYAVDQEHASGLYGMADYYNTALPLVKGQICGPVSWGLCVTDSSGKGIIYDETLADAAGKFLKLKAAWLESFMQSFSKKTVIFVDEPYLTSLGSAFVALSNEQISGQLSEVLGGIKGIKGIHCCGGTDWSLLLNLPIDIISFDAYSYLDSVLCYLPDLISHVRKGRAIAWGIVPNDEEALKKESPASLFDRFEDALSRVDGAGLSVRQLVRQGLITPTCGLASLSTDAVEYVFSLLAELSSRARRKYA
jgi:methionine synthase II (cobalamin-independent)